MMEFVTVCALLLLMQIANVTLTICSEMEGRTACESNAQDIHDNRDPARPNGHDMPLSGDEDSPPPGHPNAPPSVGKDLDIPSPNQDIISAPNHTYPPDAHKSI